MTNSVSAPLTWISHPHSFSPSPQSCRKGVGKVRRQGCGAQQSLQWLIPLAVLRMSKCCLLHVAAELSPTKLPASLILLQPQSLGILSRGNLNALSFSFFPLSGIHLQTALLLSPGKRCLAPSFLLLASAII